MKVIMKKYESTYSTLRYEEKYISWRFKKNYYDVDETEYKLIDIFVMKLFDVWNFLICKNMSRLSVLKGKIFKRISVRIDPWDTWNADHTLAFIIAPLLKQLKAEQHGAPNVDDEDVPEELRRPVQIKNEYDVDDNWHLRWEWVLGEMIWTFENIQTPWEDKYYTGDVDIYFEKVEDSKLSTMKHGDSHTFRVDTEGMKKEQERMNNALRLFGKYYFCLWD